MGLKYVNTTRILSSEEYIRYDSYMFRNQHDGIIKRVEEITDSINGNEHTVRSQRNKANNTISIVGERGSGKSSLMGTVANNIYDAGYFVLNPIDPSIFNDSLSVLEIFLSNIVDELQKVNDEVYRKSKSSLYLKVKKMMSTLSTLRLSKEKLALITEDTEFLFNINDRVNYNELMSELIDDFKKFIEVTSNKSCKGIVICVDDLDMVENGSAYQMLENIRNYLSDHVITIIAYREKQLLDIVIDERIRVNKDLLDNNIIAISEIRSQSAKYLEKIIPLNNRFHLDVSGKLLNQDIKSFLKNILDESELTNFDEEYLAKYGIQENVTVYKWLCSAIYQKSRIKIDPIDNLEFNELILPQNLRGILQMVQWVHDELSDIEEISAENIDEISMKLDQNLKSFRNYILSYAAKILDYNDNVFINSFNETIPSNKNHIIYTELSNRIITSYGKNDRNSSNIKVDIFDNILDMNYVKPFNVTLQDVHELMEEYKLILNGNTEKRYFIYLIKLLYSMDILSSLLNGSSDEFTSYLSMINSRIFDENLIRFPKFTWTLKYDGSSEMKHFFSKFGYKSRAINSDNSKIALKTINNKSYQSYQYAFRYYPQYTTNYNGRKDTNNPFSDETGDSLIKGNTYNYNPFSLFTKKGYLIESSRNDFIGCYLFYSLFDLDIFNQISFNRRSENNPLRYVLSKINRLFVYELQDREKNLAERLSINPFYDNTIDKLYKANAFDTSEIVKVNELVTNNNYRFNHETIINTLNRLKNGEKIYKNEFRNILKETLLNYRNALEKKSQTLIESMLERLEVKNQGVRNQDIMELVSIYDSLAKI